MPKLHLSAGATDASRRHHRDCTPGHAPPACRVIAVAAVGLWLMRTPAAAAEPSDEPKTGEASGDTSAVAESPVLYQTVIVAPRPSPATPREDGAAASSVVTADRTPRSTESAAELLGEMPGVTVTRLGGLGALSTVSLRGSTAEQVGVYLDGIPLNAAVGGAVDLGLLPIAGMQRLEVYRGMSPIGFGGSALGGVVSLISETPAEDQAALELGGGSFGTGFGGGQVSGSRGVVGARVGFAHLRSDNDFAFVHDNATNDPADDRTELRTNNELAQSDGNARVVVRLPGQRTLTSSLWVLQRSQGLPGSAVYPAHEAWLSTRRLIAALRYQSPMDLGPTGSLTVQTHVVGTEMGLHDEKNELKRGQQDTRDRTWLLGTQVTMRKTLMGWLRMSGIADGRVERFVPENELAGAASATPSERLFGALGIEALALWRALALDVQPSARIEVAHERITGVDAYNVPAAERDENHLLPILRLSAVQRPLSWLALKTNVGRYARLPSMNERFGNSGFFLGNPDLKPETGINADVGFVAHGEREIFSGRVEAAGFVARVDNLIQLRQGGYYLRADNVGRAHVRGLETALQGEVWRHLRLTTQFTITDARDESAVLASHGRQLPLRPRMRAHLRPELRAVEITAGLRAGVHVDVDHTSGNFVDDANLVAVPARTLLGAGIHVDYAPWGLRAMVTARNLTDQRAFDFIGYPLPGSSLFFTLQWSTDHMKGQS